MDRQIPLYVKQEVHYIAILHDIILALDAEFSGGAAGCLGLECDEVVVFDDLGSDKSLFKVGVDDPCGFRCLIAFVDGPGSDFICSGGEECLEIQQGVGGLDEPHHS